jgi:hypothetical protein
MDSTKSYYEYRSYEFVHIKVNEEKLKYTHVINVVVVLPRRNDPVLEFFLVGYSSGEQLLQRRNWPSQHIILHVE